MSYVKLFGKCFLLSVGVIPDKKHKTLEKILWFCLLTMHVILLSGEIIAFYITTEDIYRLEICYHSLCYIYICVTEIISNYNRNHLVSIYTRLIGQESVSSDNDKVVQKTEFLYKMIMKVSVIVYAVTIFVFILLPMINYILKGDYTDPLSYPLPYWFAIWKIDTIIKYFCMNFSQNILCVMVFSVYANSFSFIVCTTISCVAHITELREKIAELSNQEHYSTKLSEQYNENALEEGLKNIIKYQQRLYR